MARFAALCVSFAFAFAVAAQSELSISPAGCPPQGPTPLPECGAQGSWTNVELCLQAIVRAHGTSLFSGAVIGYQRDNGEMSVYAHGPGFATNTIVTLGSVSKPLVYVGLAKLIQDHEQSPECVANQPTCVFPQGYATTLARAIDGLDARNHTNIRGRWFYGPYGSNLTEQNGLKAQMTVGHIVWMTGGFPTVDFTGYFFGSTTNPREVACDPASATATDNCRFAKLWDDYVSDPDLRGPMPNRCKPRPAGPRLFDFQTYYNGVVYDAVRVGQSFERRYSFEPGLLGECVRRETLTADGQFVHEWVDGRTATEGEIARYFLGGPIAGQPGVKYRYAQPNLYVAALLIEELSRLRFDRYLKTNLFDRLGMTDTHFVLPDAKLPRLADVKRISYQAGPRVLPDLAPPLIASAMPAGSDRNWDESRTGWNNRWPEGGGYSTARDLLLFLRFLKDGKDAAGGTILNPDYLRKVTTEVGPNSIRTVGFRTVCNPPEIPGTCVVKKLAGDSYFTPHIQRNVPCRENIVVLPQMVAESPEIVVGNVQRCDYTLGDAQWLAVEQLVRMMEKLSPNCE